MIPVVLLILPVLWMHAEVCVQSPEPSGAMEELDPTWRGVKWHWRTVDGKKCWFRADRLLPREDLFWEYDAEEFNRAEGATVLERKRYAPENLRRNPDSSREEQARERKARHWERKQRRYLRKKDDDDDD